MLRRLLIVFVIALAVAPSAFAKGGTYVFAGGTRAEQGQVKAALDASSFDFSVVPSTVTIHIARNSASDATPGNIYLDSGLLDAGRFSWGVVQHEFAHQVDFLVLSDAARARLQSALGGSAWCAGATHSQLACERFADLVSWAYWQSPDNAMKPASAADEGGQLTPAAFRALLTQLLPQRTLSVHPPRNR
ncbi:MAG: hypothetical protein ABUS54_06475 [Actinomycetota bacterium]